MQKNKGLNNMCYLILLKGKTIHVFMSQNYYKIVFHTFKFYILVSTRLNY